MARKSSKPSDGRLDTADRSVITPEERHRMIAEAAYYRALNRAFAGGSAEDDWLQAEQDVNRALLHAGAQPRKATSRREAARKDRAAGSGTRAS